ncbi:MAG TPA: hypothetical protein VN517_14985 [Terriglobales bacterium]|nr:hypothetical protein [Terriglobales bacterium]
MSFGVASSCRLTQQSVNPPGFLRDFSIFTPLIPAFLAIDAEDEPSYNPVTLEVFLRQDLG